MSKIIVTGATGHIGNVLVRELIKTQKVTVLVLPTENLEPLDKLDVNIVLGNVTDREFIFNFIEKDDVVYHLAGLIDIEDAPFEAVAKVNIEGTKNIVDACIKNGAKKLIYTSSVHVIDPVKNEKLVEPTVFDENKVVGNYAKSKLIATRYVFEECRKHNFDAIVVYPSGVIGPYDFRVSQLGQVVLDVVNKKLPAYIEGGYDFVDVRDVVFGIIQANKKGRSGEGYLLTGRYVSLKELMQILNKIVGRKHLPPKLAHWFVHLMMPFVNLHYKVQKKKQIFTKYSLYTLLANANFDNSKARKELDDNPRMVEDSLYDTIMWFLQNKPFLISKKVKISAIKKVGKPVYVTVK